jgi:3-phenylpropionate/cinnamic acid dioxygenase small subunit
MHATELRSLNDTALLGLVTQFLGYEAMLLDEGRFEEWFTLLDDALIYEAPVRVATETRSDEMTVGVYRFSDDKQMIRTRIDRLKLPNAYAESPPSRTVRCVSAICLLQDATAGVVGASSALLLYRQRGVESAADYIPARRTDRIRLTAEGPRLLARSIKLAETVLRTPNLGIFL